MALDLSGKVSDPFINPVVRSYLQKYKVEPNRAAVISYQDSESFQQFIQQCSTRDNLQIIIVMRQGHRVRKSPRSNLLYYYDLFILEQILVSGTSIYTNC